MSISTPDSNPGKEERGQEKSKETSAKPRPSGRRSRRTSKPRDESAKPDEAPTTVDADEAAEADKLKATEEPPEVGKLLDDLHDDADRSATGGADKPAADEPADKPAGESADDTATPDADEEASSGEVEKVHDFSTAPRIDQMRQIVEETESIDKSNMPAKPDRIDPTPAPQAGPQQGLFGVEGTGDTSGMSGLSAQAGSGIPAKSTGRPYGGWFDEVADRIAKVYSGWKQAHIATIVDRGEITFYVEKSHIGKLSKVLRDDSMLRFELLASLSGVDYLRPETGLSSHVDPQQAEYAESRLHVVYHYLSMTYRRRIRVEIATTVEDPHVPTVSDVYPTADWQERETYDMFGVVFDGHHALTRILMPDDWEGFPQRKDYPLGGIEVEYKGASIPPPDQRRAYK